MPVKITPRKGRDGWPAQATIAWEAKAAHRQIMLSVWSKPYMLPDSLRFTVILSRKVKNQTRFKSRDTSAMVYIPGSPWLLPQQN